MMWKECKLYKRQEDSEVDELGNPIISKEYIKTVKARYTPWTAEDIQLNGQNVIQNNQKYVIPMENISSISYIEIDNVIREITTMKKLSNRYISLYVKKYKEDVILSESKQESIPDDYETV